MKKIMNYRCKHCGGYDVRIDAYAGWNAAAQEWEVSREFIDDAICEGECDGPCKIERYEVKGEELAKLQAYIALARSPVDRLIAELEAMVEALAEADDIHNWDCREEEHAAATDCWYCAAIRSANELIQELQS